MALSLITGALKQLGGGDIAGKLIGAGGNAILNKISDKYDLDMSSPTFDAEASAAMLADKQEANQLLKDMRAMEVQAFEISAKDTAHARTTTFSAREKMSMEHQQRVDIINLYESIAMSIGGLIVVVGSLVALIYVTTVTGVEIPEWLQVMIVATITWLTKDLISQRSNFKWGSSEGSKSKSAAIAEGEKREDMIEAKQAEVIQQLPTARPQMAIAAPAQPVITEPDAIDAAMGESLSTTRPGAGEPLL